VCGTEKDVAIYKSVTDHFDNIIGSISGNYSDAPIYRLAPLAWQQIKSFADEEKSNLVRSLKEKIGEGSAVCGPKDVLRKINETERPTLIVERHYEGGQPIPGRSGTNIFPNEDVVNEIVTTVLRRSGNVIVVENDTLRDYEGIALMFH